MNYHAQAPKRFKRSLVSGSIYRIYSACSSWNNFHHSLERAKKIMENNQYPPAFYEPIISQALNNILNTEPINERIEPTVTEPNNMKKKPLRIQYRGKCTEDYARALHKIKDPCYIIMTLRKLKTILPSMKPSVDKLIKSAVVYELKCPRCSACYVGQTGRQLQHRFKEHLLRTGPVKAHLSKCNTTLTEQNIEILNCTSKGESFLLTLEALHIRERKPSINTRDEYRSRELYVKL